MERGRGMRREREGKEVEGEMQRDRIRTSMN